MVDPDSYHYIQFLCNLQVGLPDRMVFQPYVSRESRHELSQPNLVISSISFQPITVTETQAMHWMGPVFFSNAIYMLLVWFPGHHGSHLPKEKINMVQLTLGALRGTVGVVDFFGTVGHHAAKRSQNFRWCSRQQLFGWVRA